MKKVLFFLTLVLAVAFPFFNVSINVKADETNIVLLTNSNFISEITDIGNVDFKLTEDITLESWIPINFNGNLDGNGFKITLDKNLFETLENATVSNLGVVIPETYVFDNTGYAHQNSDFGVLAQNSVFSEINNVYATSNVQVKSKTSLNVGGLIGKVEGTTIENSYVKTEIQVTQYSGEALSTVVGGFVGSSFNSIITNCFAIPASTNIINANIDESIVNPKTVLKIGGFIGVAEKGTIGVISNNFCGGNLIHNYNQPEKVSSGRILGEVIGFVDDKLSFCHTFNNQVEIQNIGKTNSYESVNITIKDVTFFNELDNFLPTATDENGDIWNFLYVWNTNITWTKKDTSSFPVLQVFENFAVTLEATSNDESLECEIFIFEDGEFIPTTLINFKFGDKLRINIAVMQDFIYYKQIKYLFKTSTTNDVDLTFNEDKSQASCEFIVNAETEGSYYATASNIEYTLIVRTADENMGYVKDNSGVNQNSITRKITYDNDYTFVADPRSITYAFENWVWVDESNPENSVEALRGPTDNPENITARKQITVGFGKNGTNPLITYLNFEITPAIPYAVNSEDGSITFILEVSFSTNVCNLNIQSTLDANVCSIYIDGILQYNSGDFKNLFSGSVQLGIPVEIKIIMNESYEFIKWKADGARPLTEFIGSDETENSLTINLKISNDFLLILEVQSEAQVEQDLMWLWIVLGVVGGLGLVTLITILIVRSLKKKDFLNYY